MAEPSAHDGSSWSARLPFRHRAPILRYGVCVLAFAIAFFARWQLDPVLPPGFPFLTFFPAIILTSFIAGLGPGILAAILSTVA
jgi:two-component system, sensor histidine kinase PdtaS